MIPIIYVGSLQIPTFFLVISLSLTSLLFFLSYRVEHFLKNRKIAFDIALLMMGSAFIGARLLHVFYEEWNYYQQSPLQILFFWQGGFVFFGGLILCFITGAIYARIQKLKFSEWADFFTPIFSLAHALGRIGCFLSGCCFGSACVLPWAYEARHPTALYLALGEFLIFLFLLFFENKKIKFHQGFLFATWLLLHSFLRFCVEFYRDDFRGLFIWGLSISQLISVVVMLLSLGFITFKIKK